MARPLAATGVGYARAVMLRVVLWLGLVAGLAGCVTAEATLEADGSARFVMVYRSRPDATEFMERRRYGSEHVRVDSVKIFEDQITVVRAHVDDVTKLGGSKGFELLDVTRQREGTDEALAITLTNPSPAPGKPEDERPFVTLTLTLPGPVRTANNGAAVLGNRLTWTVSKREFLEASTVTFRVRYAPPPARRGETDDPSRSEER